MVRFLPSEINYLSAILRLMAKKKTLKVKTKPMSWIGESLNEHLMP